MSSHRGFLSKFKIVVLGDDPNVKRGKPSPDIFIEAANRLAPLVDADIVDQGPFPDVLVFEDSPIGVTVNPAPALVTF